MSHDHLCRSDLSREKLLDNVLRLQRHRAVRDDQGVYWVEGPRGVIQAIESGRRVEHLLVSQRLLAVPYAEKLVRLQRRFGVPATRLSPEEFRRLNLTTQASGIGAVVRCHWTRLHQSPPSSGLCWVVLHHIRSAGNLGTLVRTCEALGAAGLMFIGPDIDPFDPAVVRASMGGLFHIRLVRCSADSLKHWVRRHRCDVVAAAPDARESYRSA